MGSDKAKIKMLAMMDCLSTKCLPDYYIAKYPVTNVQWAVYAKR